MYKLLLSWRYLLTRYLALASIISVMLGVATLIVVNSVMGGFSSKLKDRMRGIQADILIDAYSHDGFYDAEGKIQKVKHLLGDKVVAITDVIETFAMIQHAYKRRPGRPIVKPVRLFGVNPATKAQTGDFAQHLLSPENRENPLNCFKVEGKAKELHEQHYGGPAFEPGPSEKPQLATRPGEPPPPDMPELDPPPPLMGAVPGYGIATYRNPAAKASDTDKDIHVLEVGDEIIIGALSQSYLEGPDDTSGHMRPVIRKFVVTDLFRCEMSEYDSNIIYIDIKDMQYMRTMPGCATSLQIKLKDYERDKNEVIATLSRHFPPERFMVQTWEQKQGSLLAAISIERSLLNVLLFLIIAVAGFGILAIFFMIVVEKTRDIGILKALGASNGGVMGIFLSYGLALGIVGAGLGTLMGIGITVYINEIEQILAKYTGQEVFPRDVYYFDRIPTDMQAMSILLVNAGAIAIAVAASVFPSLRAALLHPVRALRYE